MNRLFVPNRAASSASLGQVRREAVLLLGKNNDPNVLDSFIPS